MAVNVFLGVWNEEKCQRYKVDDIDIESNVQVLRAHLTKTIGNGNTDQLEFTFCGLLLEDEKPLSNYGITSGVTIHVIQKPKPKILSEPVNKKITEAIILEFVSSFRTFRSSPSFRSTLHRLENTTELDKVIAAIPGLQDDPVAITFISKPDLFMQMEDPKTCLKIASKHPLVLIAARYVITDFHQSTLGSTPAFHVPTTSGHSYSLDALSDDDEDMEGDGSSTQGGITAAQLAAALASASATPAPRITPEMLSQALSPVNGSARYANQLRQMQEIGLNDEGRNLRALAAAQGDVQAAIELVFSGAFDD